jgi:ubiquinone/menaquinone biosynthesis C-methylase UbiE
LCAKPEFAIFEAVSIEKAYNNWASQYDTNKNKTRDLDAQACRQVLKDYSFSDVVELGCGTGKNTLFLSEKAEKIMAVDFSEAMLAKARKKIKNPNVIFKQADITQAWDVPDEFADLISVNLVLEHIRELKPFFARAQRKLKPGGILFVSELHPYKQYSGTKARYTDKSGLQELETYVHHLTDYLEAAQKAGFKVERTDEWFDDEAEKHENPPRLISFVFRK